MEKIYKDLYQFSTYIPPIDFTIHQYLLLSDPTILFAAGTADQAEAILPDIKKLLGGKLLKYIFVSHNESDEAGGLFVFQRAFPDVTVISGELTARELYGFGYKGKVMVKRGGESLTDNELELKFVDYPAEVHLQNGLICLEKKRDILYSADLMLRFGNGIGKTMKAAWKDEVLEISGERVPNTEKLEKLKNELMKIKPSFVAVGHGFCVDCYSGE